MFHLALSKNKNFWDNSITNIYLGPWMMPDVLKNEFPEYKLILPEWPWDDLDKFYNDNLKVWNEYQIFIEKLSNVLNELHGLNWNLKAWKILVGPWLRRYLSIICERNETISSLYSSYDLRSCTIMDHSLLDLQVKDFDDFSKSYHDNNFNNIIYNYILKKIDSKKKINFKILNPKTFTSLTLKNKTKKKEKIFNHTQFLNYFFSHFFKKNYYYLHSLYLKSRFDIAKLNFKLNNYPYLRPINFEVKDERKFDQNLRKTFFNKIKKELHVGRDNSFENLALELIYFMFPRCYLENFTDNLDVSNIIFKNHNPKIIIDSVSYHKDELFKFWIAQKTQKDTKLILFQHGGYYEQFKFKDDFLAHELEISDNYLTWGWKKNLKKTIPVGIPISFKKKKLKKNNNLVNIVLRSAGDYFVNFSTNGNPYKNSETYITDVINIVNNIRRDKNIRIFLHPAGEKNSETGSPLRPYLEKKIINKNVEFMSGSLEKKINETDLNLFTYIGTPYNQAISNNIPSILYHNEKYEPLNEEYRYIYNSMIEKKLMHTNTSSIVNHINNENKILNNWWVEKDTIESRNLFCDSFARKIKSIDKLKKVIQELNL